jgi:hypothetical protein
VEERRRHAGAATTVYWGGAERGHQFYHAINNMSIHAVRSTHMKICPINILGCCFKKMVVPQRFLEKYSMVDRYRNQL